MVCVCGPDRHPTGAPSTAPPTDAPPRTGRPPTDVPLAHRPSTHGPLTQGPHSHAAPHTRARPPRHGPAKLCALDPGRSSENSVIAHPLRTRSRTPRPATGAGGVQDERPFAVVCPRGVSKPQRRAHEPRRQRATASTPLGDLGVMSPPMLQLVQPTGGETGQTVAGVRTGARRIHDDAVLTGACLNDITPVRARPHPCGCLETGPPRDGRDPVTHGDLDPPSQRQRCSEAGAAGPVTRVRGRVTLSTSECGERQVETHHREKCTTGWKRTPTAPRDHPRARGGHAPRGRHVTSRTATPRATRRGSQECSWSAGRRPGSSCGFRVRCRIPCSRRTAPPPGRRCTG